MVLTWPGVGDPTAIVACASQPATSSAHAARTRLLQRVSGGAREIVRRHREAGFVQQLREAIPARDAFRAAAPSSGA